MSGIEILGVAASVASFVSLGIQLGESAMKLRRICNAIKDAPERIKSLAFALETMDMGLRQLEEHRQRVCISLMPIVFVSGFIVK